MAAADITQEQFASLVGGYGFDSFEDSAFSAFKSSLGGLVERSIGEGAVQAGGRVSMPGEYFGSPASAHTADASGTNPSMAEVTDAIARPGLPETFPGGGPSGLDAVDSVYESALKWYRGVQQSGGGKRLRMKQEHKVYSRTAFRGLVNKVFGEVRKVAKKTRLLKGGQMERALHKL